MQHCINVMYHVIAGFANRGWGGTPYPPGEGPQNLQNWLNQGFFQNFICLSYSAWSE